jgi:aromatic ring-opening dioxygenase LigB subunit
MIVAGVILPHPPIILPEYAGQRGDEVNATIAAVERACAWVAARAPERMVISSPHRGHGFAVPLSFLARHLGRALPAERVLTGDPSGTRYRDLGHELRRREDEADGRTVLVASGDLSHRLLKDGPYGFHARGPELDALIVEGVRAGDADALLAIDPPVIADGAECGLRSFVFALAALEPAHVEVLSYEGPYGVGYMVATLSPLER